MSELKPCPFCGGNPSSYPGKKYSWHISCLNSGCPGLAIAVENDEQKAIEAWNTRAERTCKPHVKAFKIGEDLVEYQALCDCGYPVGVDGTPNLEEFESIDNYCGHCGAKVVSE